jgi:hypothetical protein
LRRIGSNIRKQNAEAKANRTPRNIIRYSTAEKPRNDYPRKIVSPPHPSGCCTDENRTAVGNVREVDGFKYCYKICDGDERGGQELSPVEALHGPVTGASPEDDPGAAVWPPLVFGGERWCRDPCGPWRRRAPISTG